jgi:hypothetical protein
VPKLRMYPGETVVARSSTRWSISGCSNRRGKTLALKRPLALVLTALVVAACGDDNGGGAGEAGAGGAGYGNGGMGGSGSTAVGQASVSASSGIAGGLPDGEPCEVDGKAGVCVDVEICVGDYAPTPGFCPGPANIQCCTESAHTACDPQIMVQPNADLEQAPGVGGCPEGMIPVGTFCIDRYEAALVKVADGTPWSPYFNPGMELVRAVSVAGAVPQGYINQLQAAAACAEAGKRLCSDAEWLRACRGPNSSTYPYGDSLMLGVCNDHRDQHPAIEYFGTSDSWIFSELDNACLNQLPSSLDAAGANPGCAATEGAFDMMGNLHEWTADSAGTFRGGFYVDTVQNGLGCLYATTAHNTLHWDYSTGFRCCAD